MWHTHEIRDNCLLHLKGKHRRFATRSQNYQVTKKRLSFLTFSDDRKFFIQPLFRYGSDLIIDWAMDQIKQIPRLYSKICIAIETGAAESGRLELLKAAPKRHFKCNAVCALAAKSGNLEMLQWAREQGYKWSSLTCTNAAAVGRLDIVQWASANGCKWSEQIAVAAAESGNLELLKWLIDNNCLLNNTTAAAAALNGHLDIVVWLAENHVLVAWEAAAGAGQLDILKYALANGYLRPSSGRENICYPAAENGQLKVLEWARDNNFIWVSHTDGVCERAAQRGQLEILKIATAYGLAWRSPSSCAIAAAEGGHLHVLKWVMQNGGEWDEQIYKKAAENGHLDVLKYAIENKRN